MFDSTLLPSDTTVEENRKAVLDLLAKINAVAASLGADINADPVTPLSGKIGANTTFTLPIKTAGTQTVLITASYLVASAGGPFILTITTGTGNVVKVPISAFGAAVPASDLVFEIFVDTSGNVDLIDPQYPVNLGTVATTSGTSQELIGIPSWAKRITVTINGLSTGGVDFPILQLGDSGGYTVSGYLGSASSIFGAVVTSLYTTGFSLGNSSGAADVRHGSIVLVKISDTQWICTGVIGFSNAAVTGLVGGQVTTSATMDRLRITTVAGAVTFDAGSFTVLVE